MKTAAPDVFAKAREKFSIADAWKMLGLPGDPKPSCKSPFREDRTPSFSIHSEGRAWNDHATGEGGDVVEFVRVGIDGDHADARRWLQDRLGIPQPLPSRPATVSQPVKRIEWPAELIEGTAATWQAFARQRGYSFPSVHAMVAGDFLRFVKIDGVKCYVITDGFRRAAEIRRIDGQPFGKSKAYPLRGVDKTWLPGLEMLRDDGPEVSVFITEGATDFLTACDLYSRYRRDHGGTELWQPAAMLGAGCKKLDPEAASLIRGRHVRLCPDGDDAGDRMAEHWTPLFRKLGCTVDVIELPRGTDLSEHASQINPHEIFSR